MLYTIGTSNRSLDEFLSELRRRQITYLVDVRSSPYSRLAWFNQGQIERWAARLGLYYRHEGVILGGHSGIEVEDTRYQAALDRVLAAGQRERTVMFCAEGDPEHCTDAWTLVPPCWHAEGSK